MNEAKRKYREKNRDILNAKERKRYHDNIERERERNRLYGKEHPEKSRERSKRWVRNNPKKAMFGRAKQRAKRKGLDFTITLKDISIPAKCPILDLPLFHSVDKCSDNSPSLDRINNDKGYIRENIIVISQRANHIKNNSTADELIKIGLFLKRYDYDFSLEDTIEKLSKRYNYQ